MKTEEKPLETGQASSGDQRSTSCKRCNRALSDPVSVERGLGPVCATKFFVADTGSTDRTPPGAELPFDPESRDIVAARRENGTCITNVHRRVTSHSPDGFEFSYAGSGPADFALNILELFIPAGADGRQPLLCGSGKCSATAWELHQDFKFQFIATLPKDGGTIPGATITAWIEQRAPGVLAKVAAQ